MESVLDRLRDWDRATAAGVSHFIAISETIRERISRCYGRDSRVIEPPVDTIFYTPEEGPRSASYLCVSALVPYKRIDHAIAACTASNRPLTVIGAGPDRERLERLAGPTVQFLGWQPDEVLRGAPAALPGTAVSGRGRFRHRAGRGAGLRHAGSRAGRGGAAETVDDRVGRLYAEPSPEALRGAIDAWEADGCPHDAVLARRRAESLSTHVYRERMRAYLAEVLEQPRRNAPPAPHVGPTQPERLGMAPGRETHHLGVHPGL